MNDNNTPGTPPIVEQAMLTEEQQDLFVRLAEVSRKGIEDLVSNFSKGIAPTGLDSFHQQFAVLMGMGTANVTLLIGLLDACGMVNDPKLLDTIIKQQRSIWHQILIRKASETVQ
jgi:hypothetical protein